MAAYADAQLFGCVGRRRRRKCVSVAVFICECADVTAYRCAYASGWLCICVFAHASNLFVCLRIRAFAYRFNLLRIWVFVYLVRIWCVFVYLVRIGYRARAQGAQMQLGHALRVIRSNTHYAPGHEHLPACAQGA
jgi:hypothetical protein